MLYVTDLCTSRVKLRSVKDDDIPTLILWRNDTKTMPFWTVRRSLLSDYESINEFWADLKRDKDVMLIAEDTKQQIIGMCYSYNSNYIDGHTFVTVFVDEKYRNKLGYGIDITALFIDYLFTFFNFRKLYFETYEYSSSSSMWKKFGANLEGVFPEHHYYNGIWWTLNRFSVFRDSLTKFRKYLKKM